MGALSADRNTPERSGDYLDVPVAAAKKIYAGALVCLSATGFATPGAVATTLIAVGRAEADADNSAGADGAITVRIKQGIFRWANSAAGDAIALLNKGAACYVVDDQTVALTNGANTRSLAGRVFDVDAQGVWVDMRGAPAA